MDPHFGSVSAQNSNCTKNVVRLKVVLMMKLLLKILPHTSHRSIFPTVLSAPHPCIMNFHKRKKIISALHSLMFDTELVSKIIAELKRGRATDIDGLTAEHLTHAHPVLSVVLSKLFRIIQLCKYVPAGFGYSYIVPIAKSKDSVNKAVTYDDFRGIAIKSNLI